ncbi:MAG: hypothetical protein JXR03_14455 [Cyclobacteriaceae bacterium]
MIIYGWNTKNIKQASLDAYECPNCQEKSSYLAIFAHYAHIFWIPLFPYKKSATIYCANCQLSTDENALEEGMKTKVKALKSTVSIPKYLFIGLTILVLGIGFLIYNNNKNEKLESSYVIDPQVGDVYVLKDFDEPTDYNYYLWKVDDIEGDSLIIMFNSYRYNWVATELDRDDGFYDILLAMHKDQIKKYDESGELKKVIRSYSASSGFDRILEYPLDSLNTE